MSQGAKCLNEQKSMVLILGKSVVNNIIFHPFAGVTFQKSTVTDQFYFVRPVSNRKYMKANKKK